MKNAIFECERGDFLYILTNDPELEKQLEEEFPQGVRFLVRYAEEAAGLEVVQFKFPKKR